MAKKTCKKQKLASSTTHSLFLPVTSSHSFSCFSASLQVQQFLLMLKKKTKKTHQKKRNRKQQTNSAIAAQAFLLLPPTTLFAPFATGLLSYLVPYSIYYPPTNLFTTCLSHYLPITLPNTLLFFTTYLSLCQTLCFFFLLPTYLLFTISHSDDDEPGLFLFCQFCDDDDVHS